MSREGNKERQEYKEKGRRGARKRKRREYGEKEII